MAEKKKREGFNFYRSYYDVYKELTDKDKVLFMDALLFRQFEGVEPDNLSGMSKFAYISQKYNIDRQIKGWEDKTGVKLSPTDGGASTPSLQVQGEGKEEVQVQEKEEEKGKILLCSISTKDELQDENERIAFAFWQLFKKNMSDKGITKTKTLDSAKLDKWTNSIRLAIKEDKRTKEEFEEVWKFLGKDEFWMQNIQSTSKLREKFETLLVKSRTKKGTKKDKNQENSQLLKEIKQHFES